MLVQYDPGPQGTDDHAGRSRSASARWAEGEAHLHLAWLWSGVASDAGRERMRAHLAAARARQDSKRTFSLR